MTDNQGHSSKTLGSAKKVQMILLSAFEFRMTVITPPTPQTLANSASDDAGSSEQAQDLNFFISILTKFIMFLSNPRRL